MISVFSLRTIYTRTQCHCTVLCPQSVVMGIKSLFNYVQCALRKSSIHEFRGMRLAIDVSCLIYKGIYNGDVCRYISIYMRVFSALECEVYLVFDGKAPTVKNAELERRHTPLSQSCITSEVVMQVKQTFCDWPHVHLVQSPGESDAQMAFMAVNGLVDAVVTDDSDLIVYGCDLIIYKLVPRGYCTVYERARLLLPYDFPVFRWSCILAGCDYLLGGFPGLGLHKSSSLLKAARPQPPYDETEARRVISGLPKMTCDFVESFIEAEKTF